MNKPLALMTVILLCPAMAFAGQYWVSPAGAASWSNCESAVPLGGSAACSLSTANTNAAAGDIINLRGGTYNTPVMPSHSGSYGNLINYQAYSDESPIITNAGKFQPGIELNGKDYIKINGIEVAGVYQIAKIKNGSDYNEISNCILHGGSNVGGSGIDIATVIIGQMANLSNRNTHNWIHHNTIYQAGYVDLSDTLNPCNDNSSLMSIGVSDYDNLSGYNTIEDNIMYWGGHHIMQVESTHNAIRNNIIHNEGWMDKPAECANCGDGNNKYGNRLIMLSDVNGALSGSYNLVERNRLGHAGLASDGNGADNLTIGSDKNITRYNMIFNAMETGIYFRTSGKTSDNNKVYNNTIYKSGQGPACRYDFNNGFARLGVRIQSTASNNSLVNNIVYDNTTSDIACQGTCTSTLLNNWITSSGDPLFTNPDVSNPMSTTLPDLSLKPASGAINAGTHLTQANSSGVNSITLVVDDALYFQDGTWGSPLSNIQPDWIAIDTVDNTAQISSIDYASNTITLALPMTWSDNAKVWLYKDSSGNIVLRGPAPDIGAHEYAPPPPSAPKNLKVK